MLGMSRGFRHGLSFRVRLNEPAGNPPQCAERRPARPRRTASAAGADGHAASRPGGAAVSAGARRARSFSGGRPRPGRGRAKARPVAALGLRGLCDVAHRVHLESLRAGAGAGDSRADDHATPTACPSTRECGSASSRRGAARVESVRADDANDTAPRSTRPAGSSVGP